MSKCDNCKEQGVRYDVTIYYFELFPDKLPQLSDKIVKMCRDCTPLPLGNGNWVERKQK